MRILWRRKLLLTHTLGGLPGGDRRPVISADYLTPWHRRLFERFRFQEAYSACARQFRSPAGVCLRQPDVRSAESSTDGWGLISRYREHPRRIYTLRLGPVATFSPFWMHRGCRGALSCLSKSSLISRPVRGASLPFLPHTHSTQGWSPGGVLVVQKNPPGRLARDHIG